MLRATRRARARAADPSASRAACRAARARDRPTRPTSTVIASASKNARKSRRTRPGAGVRRCKRDDALNPGQCDAESNGSAEQREQQTLGEKLANEPRRLRAEHGANRELAPPCDASCEQKVRHVCAGEHEQQQHDARIASSTGRAPAVTELCSDSMRVCSGAMPIGGRGNSATGVTRDASRSLARFSTGTPAASRPIMRS